MIEEALGARMRIKIILELYKGETDMTNLARRLGANPMYLKEHLSTLAKAGIVEICPFGERIKLVKLKSDKSVVKLAKALAELDMALLFHKYHNIYKNIN